MIQLAYRNNSAEKRLSNNETLVLIIKILFSDLSTALLGWFTGPIIFIKIRNIISVKKDIFDGMLIYFTTRSVEVSIVQEDKKQAI